MKRFIVIAVLVLSVFTFNSCEEDRWGFDNRVVFSAAGGEEDVDGDATIYNLSIGTYGGDERNAIEVAGVLTVTYDWLTATAVKGSDEIHLIALPNRTGKQRKLIVYGAINNRFTDITVVQNK